jgi:thioredoxin 1
MALVALTKENFEEHVQKDGVLVVDWWAPWCGPCKVFAPIFEKAAERTPDVTFAKIDTDAEPELAGSFQISAVPTLMVFRDRVLVFEQAGVLRAEALDELVKQVKGLDMAEVRRNIEEQEKEHAAGQGHGAGRDQDRDH